MLLNPLTGRKIKVNGDAYYDLKAIGYLDIGDRLVRRNDIVSSTKDRHKKYAQTLVFPQDIVGVILSFCNVLDICNMRLCCTSFYDPTIHELHLILPALKQFFSDKRNKDYIAKYIGTFELYSNLDAFDYALELIQYIGTHSYRSLLLKLRFLKVDSACRDMILDRACKFISTKTGLSISLIKQEYKITAELRDLYFWRKQSIRDIRRSKYEGALEKLKRDIHSYSASQLKLFCLDNNIGIATTITELNKREAILELLSMLDI